MIIMSNDLISRQAAIDAIEKMNIPEDMCVFEILSHIEVEIATLPTIQPDPQEGYWILHESPDGGEQYECSRCGVLWEFNDGTPEDNEAYFCPKCGAKMKGAKHESN